MTARTMEKYCDRRAELQEQKKAIDAEIKKIDDIIKAECNGKTTAWDKHKAVFAECHYTKLGYKPEEIKKDFPDIFKVLGGYEEIKVNFKGIFKK